MKNLLFALVVAFSITSVVKAEALSLNSEWEVGENRVYTATVNVPGMYGDGGKMNESSVWYRKKIALPKGRWTHATLELKGARFNPAVYVNGQKVSQQEGGMAPTFHLLQSKAVKPGGEITIEVELASLKALDKTNASYIAVADHWRSNVASYIWDDVVLHLHGEQRISSIIPLTNFEHRSVNISVQVDNIVPTKSPAAIRATLLNAAGATIATAAATGKNSIVECLLDLTKCEPWTPEHPNLYQLKVELFNGNKAQDCQVISYALRNFSARDKQFFLNGNPCKVRAGTVVWHRFVRNPEAQQVAWDTTWFKQNIVMRLKEHGANTLRFHLGTPPERILDLCDRYGLLVQYEWLFFHGLPASEESMKTQWKSWLDLAMKHPSVSLIHPYNETEDNELATAWRALDYLLPKYPPLVVEDRDVIHIHKYWWSLFENLGLYYDSYKQFPKAIMVDEFGGNYLDGDGQLGGYRTLSESYMRFLGKGHTADMRLQHLSQSNSQVAEYWRRIGAAGFSPFTICSSWEDGNHWFMGKLAEGNPKPVWSALTAAYSPQSVSVELWDKNFVPSQNISLPLYFFNDLDTNAMLSVRVRITDNHGKIFAEKNVKQAVEKYSKAIQHVALNMPDTDGKFWISAELMNPPAQVKYPVISKWDVHTTSVKTADKVKHSTVGIFDFSGSSELKTMLSNRGIKTCSMHDKLADVLLLSKACWDKIAAGDTSVVAMLEQAINSGKSVVLLDVGVRDLGQGYPKKEGDLGNLQGVHKIMNGKITTTPLFAGINLNFTEAAEPESHIHLDQGQPLLVNNIQPDYCWLWNGLRGGLNVPAADMEVSGLGASGFLAQWKQRGADEKMMQRGAPYYAYELQGFYAFDKTANNKKVQAALREKVKFLVDDAPALANSINIYAPIRETNLTEEYRAAQSGKGEKQVALAVAGKNLSRMPLVMVEFGERKGKLIVSQLLTEGRLNSQIQSGDGLYDIRYDCVAEQLVLNLVNVALAK